MASFDWVAEKKRTDAIKADLAKYDASQKKKRLSRTKKLAQEQGKTDVVAAIDAEEKKDITEITNAQGQTYGGSVQTLAGGQKVFIGAREVSKEEQAQRSEASTKARYNMRRSGGQSYDEFKARSENALKPQGLRPSEDYYVKQYGTPEQKRAQFSKNYIKSTPEQRTYRTMGINVEYEATKPAPREKSGSILVSEGMYNRAQKLAEREKRLDTFKSAIYERTGLAPRQNEGLVTKVAKSFGRFPVEFASSPVWFGGRTAFYTEALFNPEATEEINLLKNKNAREFVAKNTIYTFDVKRNPDAYANIFFTALAVQSEAKSPPKFIKQTYKPYVEFENTGLKIRDTSSESWNLGEIGKLQGERVTTTHATFSDLFKKSLFNEPRAFFEEKIGGVKPTFEARAFPEKASSFRRAIGQYSFYSLLPEKATGQTQASGIFIGLGEQGGASPSKVSFQLGEPTRYINVQSDTVARLSPQEIRGAKLGQGGAKVTGGRMIVESQKTYTNTLRIAPENLVYQSKEGQLTNPVGSKFTLQESYFTEYKPTNPYKNAILKFGYDVFGKKYIIDVNKISVNRISGNKASPPESKTSFFADFGSNKTASSYPTKVISVYSPLSVSYPKSMAKTASSLSKSFSTSKNIFSGGYSQGSSYSGSSGAYSSGFIGSGSYRVLSKGSSFYSGSTSSGGNSGGSSPGGSYNNFSFSSSKTYLRSSLTSRESSKIAPLFASGGNKKQQPRPTYKRTSKNKTIYEPTLYSLGVGLKQSKSSISPYYSKSGLFNRPIAI